MLKQIACGAVLLAGLQVGTAWADEALNRALFEAIHDENVQEVQSLIARGADVNVAISETGLEGMVKGDLLPVFCTPLQYALSYKHNKVIARLLALNIAKFTVPFTWGTGQKDKYNILSTSVSADDIEITEILIQRGANISEKGLNYQPPLSNSRSKKVAELLISKGANVNTKDQYGRTALHGAASEGRWEVAELLIAKGAEVNAKDEDGKTPQDIANENGHDSEFAAIIAATQKQLEIDQVQSASLQSALNQPARIQRAAFNQALVSYQGREMSEAILRPFIALAAKLKPAPAIPEEARRYLMRGNTLLQEAKSPDEARAAAKEYQQALQIAPWWDDAYYNLSKAQELAGDFDGAASSMQYYLLTEPRDKRDAQDRLYALEAKRDKAAGR